MFKNTLKEKSTEVFICLEKGITMVDFCRFVGEAKESPYDVELYQSQDPAVFDTIVIGKRAK